MKKPRPATTPAGIAREKAGYTIEQAAALIRVKPATYRNYETGFAKITFRHAVTLSNKFGVTTFDFTRNYNAAAHKKHNSEKCLAREEKRKQILGSEFAESHPRRVAATATRHQQTSPTTALTVTGL